MNGNETEKPAEFSPDSYVGFWKRVLATIVDMVILTVVIVPLLWWIYGAAYFTEPRSSRGLADIIINYVFPAVAAIMFWKFRGATPGKMLISARIVDAVTGKPPSTKQLIGRYFSYLVSTVPLGLGFFWIAFDARKQGWHDKLAGTVVVRDKSKQ